MASNSVISFSEWNVIVFSLGVVLNVKVLTMFKINVYLNVSNVPDVAVIISTKDSPCQAPVKCASCGSNDHPVYSFRCPILKNFYK